MRLVRGMIAAWTAAAVLVFAAPAQACSVCGCGDPLLSATDPAAVSGVLRLQLDATYLTVRAANDQNPALTDDLTQTILKLNAVYSPIPGLSFAGTLPVTRKILSTAGVTSSDLSGLGDVELGGRLEVLDLPNFAAQRRQSLAVSAGSSMPTGPSDAQSGGVRVDEHGQLGTGAWGPFLGAHYRFEQGDWTAFASVSGRLQTTNSAGYRYGSALLWSVQGQYFADSSLALVLGIDGRYAAPDRQNAQSVDSTGGTVLALSPGLYWNVVGNAWLSARMQWPMYTHLFGVQSIGPVLVAGVQYLLL